MSTLHRNVILFTIPLSLLLLLPGCDESSTSFDPTDTPEEIEDPYYHDIDYNLSEATSYYYSYDVDEVMYRLTVNSTPPLQVQNPAHQYFDRVVLGGKEFTPLPSMRQVYRRWTEDAPVPATLTMEVDLSTGYSSTLVLDTSSPPLIAGEADTMYISIPWTLELTDLGAYDYARVTAYFDIAESDLRFEDIWYEPTYVDLPIDTSFSHGYMDIDAYVSGQDPFFVDVMADTVYRHFIERRWSRRYYLLPETD